MRIVNMSMVYKRGIVSLFCALVVLVGFLLPTTQVRAAGSWWDANWLYRIKLTFNNGTVTENITNALVTATLNSGNFDFSKARSDGYDIRLVDADDTTSLLYFRASWNATTEEADFIFQVPQIDASSNTDFVWLYFGNPDAGDGENKAFTDDIRLNDPLWSSRLSSGSFASVDSNSYLNTVTGAIWSAQGRTFDGADDQIVIGTAPLIGNLTTDFTLAAWANFDVLTAEQRVWGLGNTGSNTPLLSFGLADATDDIEFAVRDNAGNIAILYSAAVGGVLSPSTWYHIVLVWDADINTVYGYINGVTVGSNQNNGVGTATFDTVTVGRLIRVASQFPMDGKIGEAVAWTRTLTSAETLYQYLATRHKFGGSSYIVYGSMETIPLGAPTNLTLTDLGGVTFTANWTQGQYSTYTMLRIARIDYPATTSAYEQVYYGAGTSVNLTGYPLETTTFYVSAWGFATDNATYSADYATASIGGGNMIYLVLGLMATGLLIAMMSARQMMLGFPTALLWFILGGYSYTQSLTPWADWQYFLFFASMGIGIFSMFAAYALRTKKEEAEEGDLYFDEGGDKDVKFIDEGDRRGGSKDSTDELDPDGEKPSRRTRDIRERADKRRARWR